MYQPAEYHFFTEFIRDGWFIARRIWLCFICL